jgi:hypothetical protein
MMIKVASDQWRVASRYETAQMAFPHNHSLRVPQRGGEIKIRIRRGQPRHSPLATCHFRAALTRPSPPEGESWQRFVERRPPVGVAFFRRRQGDDAQDPKFKSVRTLPSPRRGPGEGELSFIKIKNQKME